MNRYSLNHKCLTGYTRWLLLLTALSLSAGCDSNKFIIKTEQAQQDFVILCQWWTDPIFMGGKNLAHQKEIVSDSNKVGSCGDYPFGDFYIQVLHPLYVGVNSCRERSRCKLDKFGVMMFTPVPFDAYLRTLQEKKEGDEFYDWVKAAARRQFDSHYFQYYKEARKFDLNQFKTRYQDDLIKNIELVNALSDPEKPPPYSEGYMERYWERAKNALNDYKFNYE